MHASTTTPPDTLDAALGFLLVLCLLAAAGWIIYGLLGVAERVIEKVRQARRRGWHLVHDGDRWWRTWRDAKDWCQANGVPLRELRRSEIVEPGHPLWDSAPRCHQHTRAR